MNFYINLLIDFERVFLSGWDFVWLHFAEWATQRIDEPTVNTLNTLGRFSQLLMAISLSVLGLSLITLVTKWVIEFFSWMWAGYSTPQRPSSGRKKPSSEGLISPEEKTNTYANFKWKNLDALYVETGKAEPLPPTIGQLFGTISSAR